MSIIRILLADLNPAFERAVSSAVASQPDLAVVGRAADKVQLLLRAAQADVVVLETQKASLPAIAESLTDEYPRLGVVVVDSTAHDVIVYQLRANAEHMPNSDAEHLVAAIRRAASGDTRLVDANNNEPS